MKIVAVMLVTMTFTSGCTYLGPRIPFSAEPLRMSAAFNQNESEGIDHLCNLYVKFGLAKENCELEYIAPTESQSTSGPDSDVKGTRNDAQLDILRIRRNELQHALLAESTARCVEFKDKLIKYSTRNVVGLESLSLLLSSGATVVSGSSPDVA